MSQNFELKAETLKNSKKNVNEKIQKPIINSHISQKSQELVKKKQTNAKSEELLECSKIPRYP